MKGLPRYDLNSIAFMCLIGLRVMSFSSLEAQAVISTATQLLAQKEGELNTFVDAVEENSRNCDALNGCSGGNCSRLVCYEFGIPDDPSYKCLGVANNTFCNPPCKERNFDFSRGFVRRVDTIDNHIARTVCTHRSLDDHFKNSTMSDSFHFFRVFFGAVDGTQRIYPGANDNCENIYDPRVRPWYLESTYIPKVVTVLIDSGLNMRGIIRAGNGETYISKAITTALRFLNTLREDHDYVTFMCFDGDGIKQLNDTMIYNRALLYQSFNDSLTRIVNIGSKSDPNATHTNNAINATINQLAYSNSIPENYLKVVIALIGGQQYRNLYDLNVSRISTMNLFMYSFRTKRAAQCNPAIRASLEEIPDERLNNPLYALQSYYSFLAKLHRSFMKNQTDYGPQYQDVSGIDAHTLTLSKAAFGPSGELLGVLGLDFFEQKVQKQYPTIQFQSIVEEAGKHDPGRIFNTLVDLDTNVCFNHTDVCPGLDTTIVEGFLCERAKLTDEYIGCCGQCKPPITPPTSPPHKPKKTGKIVGGIVGGIVGLVLVIIFLARRRIEARIKEWRKRPKTRTIDIRADFPGDQNEATTRSVNEATTEPVNEAEIGPQNGAAIGPVSEAAIEPDHTGRRVEPAG